MELDKLWELVDKTKGLKNNPACTELAEQFEAFIDLMQQQKDGISDKGYFNRLELCMKQFWTSFDKAAESVGLSPDAIKANLNNPDYFAPDQWKAMQAIKQEITGEKPVAQKPKKSKENKKKMRI